MCVPQIYCNNESYYRTKGGMEGGARSNSGNRIRWTLLPRRGRVRADDEKVYVRDCWLTPEWEFLRAIINPIGE